MFGQHLRGLACYPRSVSASSSWRARRTPAARLFGGALAQFATHARRSGDDHSVNLGQQHIEMEKLPGLACRAAERPSDPALPALRLTRRSAPHRKVTSGRGQSGQSPCFARRAAPTPDGYAQSPAVQPPRHHPLAGCGRDAPLPLSTRETVLTETRRQRDIVDGDFFATAMCQRDSLK